MKRVVDYTICTPKMKKPFLAAALAAGAPLSPTHETGFGISPDSGRVAEDLNPARRVSALPLSSFLFAIFRLLS